MARIAFAWELGGELGHAISCSELARSLTARGHQVAFVFRELHNLRFLPNPIDGIEVFQAPVVPLEGLGESPPATFADILRGCGYRDPAVLGRLVAGWREIFARWKPDLVVEDFAPTALLAARIDGLRRVRYGNGFAVHGGGSGKVMIPPCGSAHGQANGPLRPDRIILVNADGVILSFWRGE